MLKTCNNWWKLKPKPFSAHRMCTLRTLGRAFVGSLHKKSNLVIRHFCPIYSLLTDSLFPTVVSLPIILLRCLPISFCTPCLHFHIKNLSSAFYSSKFCLVTLLQSEILSGICAKLRTVTASNNRIHMPWSLYYCSFAPHICMVLFFTYIPFVVNHTINTTPPERLQQRWMWTLTKHL